MKLEVVSGVASSTSALGAGQETHELRFPADLHNPQAVQPGDVVRVTFTHEAILPYVRKPSYHGRPTWQGRLGIETNGSRSPEYVLFAGPTYGPQGGYTGHRLDAATLRVPDDARSLKVWVETKGLEGTGWYSDYGRNFPIPVGATRAGSASSVAPADTYPKAGSDSTTSRGPSTLSQAGRAHASSAVAARKVALASGSAVARRACQELKEDMIRSVDAFLRAWNGDGHYIPTNIDGEGNVVDHSLTVLNQSRHIYGLAKAYEATGDTHYLGKAQAMARHFQENFIDESAKPPRFFEGVSFETAQGVPGESDQLTVNYQSYGLAGLVALYGATRDEKLLGTVRRLHYGFVERFHDPKHGGFFDHVDVKSGANDGLKGFNSTVYVATSYLLDLAEIDQGPGAPDYDSLLRELGDLVVDRFVDKKTGFLIENFDAQWQPSWRGWQLQVDDQGRQWTISPVGHNTQAAWLLLRLYERFGDERFRDSAIEILNFMLAKGYDWDNGGVFDAAKREETDPDERWMWGTNKAWWQQAETMQALLLADKLGVLEEVRVPDGTGLQALEQTLAFWRGYSRPTGGSYEQLERNGTPVAGNLGHAGKATYHVAQLADAARKYAKLG